MRRPAKTLSYNRISERWEPDSPNNGEVGGIGNVDFSGWPSPPLTPEERQDLRDAFDWMLAEVRRREATKNKKK